MQETEDADIATEVGSQVTSRPHLPTLDLGRLAQRCDDLAQQQNQMQQQEHQAQQQHHRSSASPPPNPNKRVHKPQKLRLARLARLDGSTKAKITRSVQTSQVKSWLHAHGYVVKAEKLHPAVTRVIEEWFQLVDDDNSRTLEHRELLTALKAARIPCDDATITEMIQMMDMNRDGVIDWDEFEVFMTEEFAAGKSLLSGEYVLPSGQSINFGVMIGKLKRNKLLSDIMEDPRKRNKWAAIASNADALGKELATMQQAADAASLTLDHLKGGGATGVVSPTPRTQLTTAVLRTMDDDRRAAKAADPARSVREKVQSSSGTGSEPSEPPCDYLSSSTTSKQRPCPDPTASPLMPPRADIGFYSYGPADPLMQPPPTSGNDTFTTYGGVSSFGPGLSRSMTPATSFGSSATSAIAAVGPAFRPSSPAPLRMAAAPQQSSYNVPPPPGLFARPPEQRRMGPGSSAAPKSHANSEVSAPAACYIARNPSPAVASYRDRRASDVAYAPAASVLSYLSPSVPGDAPHEGYKGVAASRLSPKTIPGRVANRSPVPFLSAHSPLEPHHVVASTVSSVGHRRPPVRAMSHVSLMAKELRGPRFPMEQHSGLAPTGSGSIAGSYRSCSGAGVAPGRFTRGTADGCGAASPPMSPRASRLAPSLLQLPANGRSTPAAAATPPISPAPASSYGNKPLPVLQQTNQLPDLLDGAMAASGSGIGGTASGSSSRSVEVFTGAGQLGLSPLRVVLPGPGLGPTIGGSGSPTSPRPPSSLPWDARGDSASPRTSGHAIQRTVPTSSTAQEAAPAQEAAAAQMAGPYGSSPTGTGGSSADRALRPTSSLCRTRSGATPPGSAHSPFSGAASGIPVGDVVSTRQPLPPSPAAAANSRDHRAPSTGRQPPGAAGCSNGGQFCRTPRPDPFAASGYSSTTSPLVSMYGTSTATCGDVTTSPASVDDEDGPRGSGMGGHAPEGGGRVSGNRPGGRMMGLSRGVVSPAFGQEFRPPSRGRTAMAGRGEKEDLSNPAWRASAASLLQLRLSKQLEAQET